MSSKLVSGAAEVIQLYRYPGISPSAASTLLHKVSSSQGKSAAATIPHIICLHSPIYSGFGVWLWHSNQFLLQNIVCNALIGSTALVSSPILCRCTVAYSSPTATQQLQGCASAAAHSYLWPCCCHPSALLQVQHKVSDAITSIDGELCYNVGLAAPLDAAEAEKMAW